MQREAQPRRWGEYTPAVAGVAGAAVCVVAADVWAVRTHRPTVSRLVAALCEHDVLGPVTIGVLTAGVWHLVVDPIIKRLEV
jgi:hypothetical protein